MTVMNSVSQGGTVSPSGRVELMQHRTSDKDDGRGMGESLFDVDSDGQPIRVKQTYYVQIFDPKNEASE